jgi:hypothetical protein
MIWVCLYLIIGLLLVQWVFLGEDPYCVPEGVPKWIDPVVLIALWPLVIGIVVIEFIFGYWEEL